MTSSLGLKKELAYESLTQLEETYEQAVKSLDFNNQSICNKLLKMYDRGFDLIKLGDEENGYGFLLRFMTAVALLKKSTMYRNDKKFVDSLITAKKIESCWSLLEKVRPELKTRYESKSLKKTEIEAKPAQPETKTSGVELKIQDIKSQIAPHELIDLIQRSSHSILIIDTRTKSEFARCRLNLDLLLNRSSSDRVAYMNIPSELINEVSWRVYEELRSNGDTAYEAHVFSKRQTYDLVVLLDKSSDLTSAKYESKMLTLKRALYEYDQEKVKREPIILAGGYDQWYTLYPGYTRITNSNTNSPAVQSTESARKNSLYDFDYPSIEEKSKPSPSPSTPPAQQVSNGAIVDLTGEKASVNRVIEPTSDPINKLNIVDPNRQVQTNKVPNIDRSMKPVMIKKPSPPATAPNEPQSDVSKDISSMKIDPTPSVDSKKTFEETRNIDSTPSAPNSSTIPLRPPKQPSNVAPKLDEPVMFDSNSIINSVYMPPSRANRLIQTRDGTNKQLNQDTGLFSYVPTTTTGPDRPTTVAKPLPPDPSLKPKPVTKPAPPKFESSMKRTFSSPNIAKLDEDSDDDDDAQIVTPSKIKAPIKQVPVKPPQPPVKPIVPLVDRFAKPMSEQVLRSRLQELQPIYGNTHPGLVGLRNLGNSCFMNSIIQCLSSTKELVGFFLTDKYRKDLNRSNHLGFGGEIADEFAVIVQAIWGGHCKIISPRRFKSLMGQFNQQFVSNDQQDAQELLLSLLDGLHEDLNRVTQRPKLSNKDDDDDKEERLSDREAASLAWKRHLSLNNSIIVDLFQGQFKSTVTCLSCNKSSRRFDAFMYLTLPLPSTKCNIYQCIDMFLQPENMMGESKWKCPRCKQYRDAVKKIDIWQLPPILIVHLKRFKYQGIWRDKVTTMVDYPIGGESGVNLNLDSYVINGAQQSHQYKLYAVSNHTGTLDGGHYTAACKNFQFNRWFKYDDSEVKEASASSLSTTLVSSASYILFYSRC